MFLVLIFLPFPIALNAFQGSLEMRELKVRFDFLRRDLTWNLDRFLLSLSKIFTLLELLGFGLSGEDMVLALLRFFLICASIGHLGGLGGGGGSVIALFVAEEYLRRAQLTDVWKDSKRAIEGEIVYEATRLLRIGEIFNNNH